jgi:hypothetical protein
MPGTSYGISAKLCKTGSKLAEIEGSICYDCYALGANYQYPSVAKAHANRIATIYEKRWPSAMAFLILRSGTTHHRWHDSGDIQSVEHLRQIVRVCLLTPKVKHWLPVKELAMLLQWVKQGGVKPKNLCIRLSAYMVDGDPSPKWPVTSGVYHNRAPKGHRCVAPDHDNTCGPCRACWDDNVKHVEYCKH